MLIFLVLVGWVMCGFIASVMKYLLKEFDGGYIIHPITIKRYLKYMSDSMYDSLYHPFSSETAIMWIGVHGFCGPIMLIKPTCYLIFLTVVFCVSWFWEKINGNELWNKIINYEIYK